MITFNDLDCYLIHYTKAIDRKKFMSEQLMRYNILDRVKWIESHDKEDIRYLDYVSTFSSKIPYFNVRTTLHVHGFGIDFYLKPSEVSCAFKHKQAMIDFVNTNNQYYFVMEDDIIFEDDFISKLNLYFQSLPDDWDVLFIGCGANKRVPKSSLIRNKYWYPKEFPADRCADSIIIKRSAVKRILADINTIGLLFPIDHEFSFWFEINNLNVYWLEPPVTKQGSQCGMFKSLLMNTENLL